MSRVDVEDLEVDLSPGGDGGGGTVLAVRVHHAEVPAGTPARGGAVLVHGLASNARMWDACAEALAAAGVTSVAPDLRGHGRSAALAAAAGLSPADAGPYGTPSAAADVTRLVHAVRAGRVEEADGSGLVHHGLEALGRHGPLLTGPVVLAGQSWGGNVVLTAAAAHPGLVDALALVDGGWLRFDTDEPFARLWERLAPPRWDGTTWGQARTVVASMVQAWGPHATDAVMANLTTGPALAAGHPVDPGDPAQAAGAVRNVLDLGAHEQILRSLHEADPRSLYPSVAVPVLLAPAGDGPAAAFVDEALHGLPDARLSRYPDAHHDLHLQHPARLAADLLGVLDLPGRPEQGRPHPEDP